MQKYAYYGLLNDRSNKYSLKGKYVFEAERNVMIYSTESEWNCDFCSKIQAFIYPQKYCFLIISPYLFEVRTIENLSLDQIDKKFCMFQVKDSIEDVTFGSVSQSTFQHTNILKIRRKKTDNFLRQRNGFLLCFHFIFIENQMCLNNTKSALFQSHFKSIIIDW